MGGLDGGRREGPPREDAATGAQPLRIQHPQLAVRSTPYGIEAKAGQRRKLQSGQAWWWPWDGIDTAMAAIATIHSLVCATIKLHDTISQTVSPHFSGRVCVGVHVCGWLPFTSSRNLSLCPCPLRAVHDRALAPHILAHPCTLRLLWLRVHWARDSGATQTLRSLAHVLN